MNDSLLRLIEQYGPPLVALLVFAVELGVPTGIPIELALLAVGAYGIGSVPGMIVGLLMVAFADVAGACVLFWISRTGGTRLLGFFMKKTGNEESGETFKRWHGKLGGRDSLAVFVGRTLPLMRKPTTIGAGIVGISFRSFLLGSIPAGFFGSGLPLVIGYLIQDDVQRFADEYTRLSHVLVLISPAIGLLVVSALWVRGGKSLGARFSRTRAVIGLTVIAIAVGFAIYTGWKNEWANDPAEALLPTPLLELWLTTLGALVLVLLGIAVHDIRNSANARHAATGTDRPMLSSTQAMLTIAWVGLVIAVGAFVITLQVRYPVL